ncbi:hypothetical protein SAMN05216552_1010133 [Pseudoduganella namucuonensis]|uniref:Uncharacterized protein n=1 Tax=Pseudoduganella namucuonensis TaxID=1035707 RepID=A0A1I7J7U7_9BURK|nr:hypothetical protein SAMN05216552_1010133 [Pseudoduganella namucuonensis]
MIHSGTDQHVTGVGNQRILNYQRGKPGYDGCDGCDGLRWVAAGRAGARAVPLPRPARSPRQ